MDKEISVKVTRLRHSLVAETDEVKSPSTQSTPKKRGGKLATKPQLELIHENATIEENEPKKRRRSTARVAEVDEKVLTPSRRSTRIRSNTSNVSETPTEMEDKGTPSRRTTRIRSNTSLIAETVQYEHSPRAQRAARRTSLAGSDTESTITPVKQTRRTRRDSASSTDKKAESNVSKLGIQPNLVIIEEKLDKDDDETKIKEEISKDINESPSIRRSPRLVEKSGKKSLSQDGHNKENEPETVKTDDSSKSEIKTDNLVESSPVDTEQKVDSEINDPSKSSSLPSNDLEIKPKKKNTALNNSTSAIERPVSKPQRQRTKSWTTIPSTHTNDHSFLSDTEANKQKTKKERKASITFGSGDGLLNTSNNKADKENSLNLSISSKKSKKSLTSSNSDIVNHVNAESELNLSSHEVSSKQPDPIILGNSPKCLIKSIVFIEDTDSNASTADKANVNYEANTEDQCVPVVTHDLVATETQNNLSYEPMDIDETITENTSAIFVNNPVEEIQNNSVLLNNSKNISNKDMTSDFNENDNKSKRKYSVPSFESVKTENDTSKTKTRSNSIIVTDNDDLSKIPSNMDVDQNLNASNSNETLRTSNQDHGNSAKIIKSNRKSSISDASTDDNKVKKSKRKSSMSAMNDVDNNSSILNSEVKPNKSRGEAICDSHDIIDTNPEPTNRSKRIPFSTADDVSKSKDNNSKTLIDVSSHEDVTMNNANNMNNDISSVVAEIEPSNKSLKKDKRKSIITNKDNDNANESVNKSSRKSSISHMELQSLDKSNNENKSTLILSQIKDTSESNFEINEPLSKSLDVPNIKTDIEKKNLSFAYSTSTPLQQKSLKNLGMQINTSDINSTNDMRKNKTEKKDITIKRNKKSTVLQNREESQSSDEDEKEENTNDANEEEDSEEEKNNMFFDAEAEDASEDYESGDSRDDDEKEYEEQNAVVDKGESLGSEDEDFSDDSEYENDSFVVDSDEEDNNLLSGSGDDLDMTDDELNMSAKSKKKFNARKSKEQKKASREMFNARHEQDESNTKSDKKKPKKVNRQRLDSSDSGVEKETPKSKISRRARIDSSQDISQAEANADNSMLVKKKKTKRLSESICEDENAITINQSVNTENIDPLSLKDVVKQEPKTPQKDLDISTVVIKNTEEFENVEIDENVSINKTKLNMSSDPLQNTMAQDDATDSEESISENEEISKNYDSLLSALNTAKVKTADISLNLHKKAKQKSKEPIIDELNLTQVKTKKTPKLSDDLVDLQNVSKDTSKVKPLNSLTNQDEDSSDSIDMKLLFNEDSTDSENKVTAEEMPDIHIPLKRTEGKTNILESGKETETASFFIDTKGTHTDDKEENVENSSINTSSKKKKKTSISLVDNEEVKDEEPEVNISATGSNKKKKKKLSQSFEQETAEQVVNDSDPVSDKKKKKKLSMSLNEPETEEQVVNDSVSDSNKKKKKKLSLSLIEQETGEQVIDNAPERSSKKKKHKTVSEEIVQVVDEIEGEEGAPEKSSKKKKHKTVSEEIVQVVNEIEGEQIIENAPERSSKKKKHKTAPEEIVQVLNEIEDNEIVIDEEVKTKKRKRKRSANQSIGPESIPMTDTLTNEPVVMSHGKKKLKLMHEEVEVEEDNHTKRSDKKKKNKSEDDQLLTVTTKKNKKRKHSDLDDNVSKDDKEESSDRALVPRLPAKIIKQLSDKPKKDNLPKAPFISTTAFKVEKTEKKRMKPSNYLEQSVYLNDSIETESKKSSLLLPKVWPSVPAVSLSNQGFTTKFKVDVIPRDTKFVFVAQSNDIPNFKQDFLQKNRINKLGSMEMHKRRRNIKLSKF